MLARMVTMHRTDICNVNPIASRPWILFPEEWDAMDLPTTIEDDEYLIDCDDARQSQANMQRMVESALKMYEEPIMERRLSFGGN